MSIGEVLAQLRPEFPDTTISKLRFLESEGLVGPEGTAAGGRQHSRGGGGRRRLVVAAQTHTAGGYGKSSRKDAARLRYVLTAQRDHSLPLRVIRDQLDALDSGQPH